MLYSRKPKCQREESHIPSNAEAGKSEVFSVGENGYLAMIDDAEVLLEETFRRFLQKCQKYFGNSIHTHRNAAVLVHSSVGRCVRNAAEYRRWNMRNRQREPQF
jgi:hypothetical protein